MCKFCFFLYFLRDLKKAEELVELENAKADSESQKLEFLLEKSENFKVKIQASEVDGRNFLTRHCDEMAQSWLVGPKIVVTETSQELPEIPD